MCIVGTIARATANSLSLIIFIVVGLAGGMYGRSVGGGVGTVIMAISCGFTDASFGRRVRQIEKK